MLSRVMVRLISARGNPMVIREKQAYAPCGWGEPVEAPSEAG
ncbi:hypothetical protein QFZ21_000332 [Microbacterium sp. W4I20]|nr:hypothetical protein [Microbacterium sp. W4I20]